MHRFRLILAALLFVLPFSLKAADIQQQMPESAGSVEEPDADDDDGAAMPPQEETPPVPVTPSKPVTPDVKPPSAEGDEGSNNYDHVLLQGLNKVTARAQTIEAPIGGVIRFGTLDITAHNCWKAAPDERPENAALLEISEIKQNEAPSQIFMGWMFSSTPGLSGLENPFYDITVISCEKEKAEKMPPAPAPEEKKAKKGEKKKDANAKASKDKDSDALKPVTQE